MLPPRLRLFASLAFAGLSALVPRAAGATMIVPLSLDELIDDAERVSVVRVEGQTAHWSADHSFIYTEITVRVVEPLKGDGAAGEVIAVRREGGVVGEVGMYVAGAAGFKTGEEVLVFLERRGSALWTVGMAQGRMPVGTLDGRRVVVRQTAGLGFVRAPQPEPSVRALEEVRARVADRLRAVPRTPGATGSRR